MDRITELYTWIMQVEDIKRQTRATYGCVAIDQNSVTAGLSCGLYAGSVCGDSAAEAAYAAIVALY